MSGTVEALWAWWTNTGVAWLGFGSLQETAITIGGIIGAIAGLWMLWIHNARNERETQEHWRRQFAEAADRLLTTEDDDEVLNRTRRRVALMDVVQLGLTDPEGSGGVIWGRCKTLIDTLHAEIQTERVERVEERGREGHEWIVGMAARERRRRAVRMNGLAALDFNELVTWAHHHFAQEWGYLNRTWIGGVWLTVVWGTIDMMGWVLDKLAALNKQMKGIVQRIRRRKE